MSEVVIRALSPGDVFAAELLLDAELGGRHQARLGKVHDVLALAGYGGWDGDRLVGIATYLYRAEHAALIPTYLQEGNSPDAPGNLVAWMHKRVPVYGYRFRGNWVDIGDKQQLLDADNRLRVQKGMPPRAEYSL